MAYDGNSTALTILQATTSGPKYSTATYPATSTVSQILYSSSTNVIGGLATANNGLLVTGNTGIPSVLAGPGTTGQVLQANAAAAPSFSTATFPSTATGTGTLLRADGTNWVATTSTYPTTNAVSTLLYASSANVMGALATANSGILATGATGVPSITAASGNWLNTSRCAFSAYLAGTVLNKTGQNESYTLGTDALTEIFDQGNDFNTNGTFTAPVTGRYLLTGFVVLTDCLASASGIISIVTTARTYIQNFSYPVAQNGYACFTVFADMAATNTATVAVQVGGEASTRVDIFGAATVRTGFSGHLVC